MLSICLPACITLPLLLAGSRDSEWKKGVDGLKLLPEVLKDCIHVVKFYLLDGLPEPLCEVPYGLFFVFQNNL